MRPSARLLLVVAVVCTASCTPTPTSVTVNFGGAVFPMGIAPNRIDDTFTFYAGSNVDAFTLSFTASGLSPTMALEVRSGSGAVLQTVNAPGAVTAAFAGNVGSLRFVNAALGPPASLTLTSMTMTSDGTPHVPEVVTAVSDRVASMPLTLNTPVEIAFPPPGTPKSYFMAVTGVSGRTLDVVLDGPGRVFLRSDPAQGFLLPEGGDTGEPGGFTTTTGASSVITMGPGRDTLLLTVGSVGIEGHSRVSVNVATRLIALRAQFWSTTAITPAQTAVLTAILNLANADLYRATQGHVRIGSLTLLSRINSSDGTSTPIDLYVVPPVSAAVFVPPVPTGGGFIIDLGGGPGLTIASELLGLKLGIPAEPRDANGALTCPNSMMNNGGLAVPVLCRRENHNPFGSNLLGAVAPRSGWEILAPALGLPVPAATPPRPLRTATAVTFPIATTIVP
jgi:hypothetical protein